MTDTDEYVTERPTWNGQDVSIGDVVNAVEHLRRTEQKAATRASVATLIIVARDDDQMSVADSVIEHLGTRHPARIITLYVPEGAGDAPDRIDADVTLLAGEAEGHPVWSDEISLRVCGGPARHLASLLRPLQLADLPVVVWYVKGLPDEGDPLLKLSNAVIVDTKIAIDNGESVELMHQTFSQVGVLSRKQTIIDLSWHRLRTWRQLLAALFNGDVYRPFIQNVKAVEVSGKLGPRVLLSGWLASRLRLDREHLVTHDARHVSIKMHCEYDGRTAEFKVERNDNSRLVTASVSIEGGPHHEELLGLPDDAMHDSLSSSLKRIERDRVYEQAIRMVAGWL